MNLRNGLPLLTVIVLYLNFLPATAQPLERSDSLKLVLQQKDLGLKERIVTMGLLGESMVFADVEDAIRIEREALKLCTQLNDPEMTVSIYFHLVMLHAYHKSDIKSARQALDSTFLYANKTNNRKFLGMAWYRKAWLDDTQSKTNDAVKSAMEALKYLESTDGYRYQAGVYFILSGVYGGWDDLKLQGEYAHLCLKAALKSSHLDFIMFGYSKVANYYQMAYRSHREDGSLLDSALIYNRRGIRFFQAHEHQVSSKSFLSHVTFDVACLYQKDYAGIYNKDSLEYYLNIALRSSIETRQTGTTALCYAIMSDGEIDAGNFQKGESLLLKALTVIRSDSASFPDMEIQIQDGLVKVAEKSGNYARALKYYRDYHTHYEKFYNAEKLAMAKDLEAKYQSEKSKDALAELTRTAALNRKLTYLYIALFITLGIALLFIVRSLRFRLKATMHQKKLLEIEREESALLAQIRTQENKRLELEKQEAELHARLKEEEAMRLQAERQLLEERQERLQKDLLAGSLQVEQKDEILQAVQKKIEESNNEQTALKQINKMIDQNKKVDENFASYKADLDNIRPEFFEKLREKSGNTLSRLELKHCSYISMGLTNKEVALRLGVAPKTVVMARYRIKIKLGLPKDENIDAYIIALR